MYHRHSCAGNMLLRHAFCPNLPLTRARTRGHLLLSDGGSILRVKLATDRGGHTQKGNMKRNSGRCGRSKAQRHVRSVASSSFRCSHRWVTLNRWQVRTHTHIHTRARAHTQTPVFLSTMHLLHDTKIATALRISLDHKKRMPLKQSQNRQQCS